MLPRGVTYHASWVDSAGTRCFRLMEAQHPNRYPLCFPMDDPVDSEIVPSPDFCRIWSKERSIGTNQIGTRAVLQNSCFLTKARQLIKFRQLFQF